MQKNLLKQGKGQPSKPIIAPPKQWLEKMLRLARVDYKKVQSPELDEIIANIWSRFSDATRQRLIAKYAVATLQPDNNGRHNQLPCPICEYANPVYPHNLILKCKECGYKLRRVKFRRRF